MPAAQHTVISSRGTMISVLSNNRRLWQQGRATAMPAAQHTVISGRGGSRVSGILGQGSAFFESQITHNAMQCTALTDIQ